MTEERVIPGIKYGIYTGELLPSCRSIAMMLQWMDRAADMGVGIKLPSDINDDDRCQRGPDGTPLHRVTPLVPWLTKAE